MKRSFLMLLLLLIFLTTGDLGSSYDVIIVRDDIALDWIIAQAYSHKSGIPIITTPPDQLHEDAKAQLKGFKKAGWNNVLVFGGEKAISLEIERELTDLGFITHRISEVDRYGTYARIALELYGSSDGCIMVNGEDYEDLLLAERIATASQYPMLLIKRDKIPESVQEAVTSIGCKNVILVGPGISEEVYSLLTSQGLSFQVVKGMVDIEDYGPRDVVKTEYLYLIFGLIVGALFTIGILRYRKSPKKVPYTLLTEDEEKVIKVISNRGGEIKQEELTELTDFSRPKISRLVSELVGRDLILKEQYKRTYKLKIKKEFY